MSKNFNQPHQSNLFEESKSYVKFTREGATELVKNVTSADYLSNDCSYRQYKDSADHRAFHQQKGSTLFVDQFNFDRQLDFPEEDVIIKRLCNMYGVTNRPRFFSADSKPTRPKDPRKVPQALNQLGLFDLFHYRSLFITQDYSSSGKYELILNIEGRFQLITVDDRIPIYANSLEPIWGLTYKNSWQLILIKAYAKVLGGYNKLWEARPFDFVERVSNSPWKYYNLSKQADQFLDFYSEKERYRRGKIIFKTKKSQKVKQAGLLPDSASYELINLCPIESEQKQQRKKYLLTIRGTNKTNWTGHHSFLDHRFQQYYQNLPAEQKRVSLNIDRDFMISHQDVVNLFSSAYITSNRNGKYFTGYKLLQIVANEKKAQHLQFYFPDNGFLDFSIKQFSTNITKAGQKSSVQISSFHEKGERYLKTSYILVRDKDYIDPNDQQFLKKDQNMNSASHIYNGMEYAQTRYSIAQIDHTKGYNQGDAFFIQLTKGKYILRFKSQKIQKDARYAISWVASSEIQVQKSNISHEESITLLHDAVVSKMHKIDHLYLAKDKKEMLSIADTFQELGYGFIAVKNTKDCDVEVKISVNPAKLQEEGYALKGRNKNTKQPFEVVIGKGQYSSIVLKKIKNAIKYVPLKEATGYKILKKNGRSISIPGITTQTNQAPSKMIALDSIPEQRRVTEQGNQPEPNSRAPVANQDQRAQPKMVPLANIQPKIRVHEQGNQPEPNRPTGNQYDLA